MAMRGANRTCTNIARSLSKLKRGFDELLLCMSKGKYERKSSSALQPSHSDVTGSFDFERIGFNIDLHAWTTV